MSSLRKVVLALCAHPDDAEFKCGGALILLAQRGWKVHIATLCVGDCGSAELGPNKIAVLRRGEAEKAAAYVGGAYHCLGFQDLRVFEDDVSRPLATALIRRVNPDFVITHFPQDYMPDHEVASSTARAAMFCASIINYAPGPCAVEPPTDSVVPLYYFTPLGGVDYLGRPVEPEILVDVSGVIDKKAEFLGQHASQREWLRKQHGMDHYIEEMKARDAELGRRAGVTYAEGFFTHKGHAYPQTPLLQEALADLIAQV